MSYSVFVIKDDFEPALPDVYAGLAAIDPSFGCQRTAWSHLSAESLNSRDVDLIVAVAPSDATVAVSISDWLREHALRMPTFAVLPEHPDEKLLQSASQTADEFILHPIRSSELRHRLCRVLAAPRHDLEVAPRRLLEEIGLTQLIGRSSVFLEVIEQVPRFARAEVPVPDYRRNGYQQGALRSSVASSHPQ